MNYTTLPLLRHRSHPPHGLVSSLTCQHVGSSVQNQAAVGQGVHGPLGSLDRTKTRRIHPDPEEAMARKRKGSTGRARSSSLGFRGEEEVSHGESVG